MGFYNKIIKTKEVLMTQTDQEAIIALQHQIWEAYITKNIPLLEMIYPDNHYFRHTGGRYQARDEFLADIKSGVFRYYSYLPESETVTFLSDSTAILHIKAKTDARIYGFRKVWRMDFDLAFEKIDGRWRPAEQH